MAVVIKPYISCTVGVSKSNFVVKRSAQKFNQVDPDQAMEWINCTGKKGGGIVGITKTISAHCTYVDVLCHTIWGLILRLRRTPCIVTGSHTRSPWRYQVTAKSGHSWYVVIHSIQKIQGVCISYSRVLEKSRHKRPGNRWDPKLVTMWPGTQTRTTAYIRIGKKDCTRATWQARCLIPRVSAKE